MTAIAQEATIPLRAPSGVASRRPVGGRMIGPALLVSAGYLDPGNWGADVAAGAGFGFSLLWVLGVAILAGLLLQQLSARLGLATGHDLAYLIRTQLHPGVGRIVLPLLFGALTVTELVEVLGVVLGVQLLTGWPPLVSVAVAAGLVLLVTVAPAATGRRVVYGCLAVIAAVYLVVLSRQGAAPATAFLQPQGIPPHGLLVAVGLVGSIVMPHNILLQSSLASHAAASGAEPRALLRGSCLATGSALLVAFAVNVSITSLAARPETTGAAGAQFAAVLNGAQPELARGVQLLFAFTLLAAGLASATAGGLASPDVIAGIAPNLRLRPPVRRLCCLVPAIAIAGLGLPEITLLLWSQVLLAGALPLVLLPLIWFTGSRRLMGELTPCPVLRSVAAAVTLALLAASICSVIAT